MRRGDGRHCRLALIKYQLFSLSLRSSSPCRKLPCASPSVPSSLKDSSLLRLLVALIRIARHQDVGGCCATAARQLLMPPAASLSTNATTTTRPRGFAFTRLINSPFLYPHFFVAELLLCIAYYSEGPTIFCFSRSDGRPLLLLWLVADERTWRTDDATRRNAH